MASVEMGPQICTLEHGARRINRQSSDSALRNELERLSRTNHIPSDAETLECRRIVAESLKDVADISDEVAMARAHLEHLQEELRDAQRVADVHQKILQSPRRLHKDVLLEIFRMACEPSIAGSPHSLDPYQPAWRLAQVCQSWRTCIVDEMPFLWTDIKIIVDAKFAKRGFLLEHLLRRSKGRPLDVTLRFHNDFKADSAFTPLLTRITMTCDRWRSLNVKGWLESFKEWNKDFIKDNTPLLQTLSHQIHSSGPPEENSGQIEPFFSSALTTLRITGWLLALKLPRSLKHVTWGRSTINNARISMSDTVGFLGSCPDIETCTMDCVYRPTAPAFNLTPALLPKLHTLSLQSLIDIHLIQHSIDADTSQVERTLDYLYLPALTTLCITGKMYHERSLVNCLQRSKCSLRILKVSLQELSHLDHILALAPSLTFLRVEVASDSRSILSALTHILDMALNHCSGLQKLRLRAVKRTEVDITKEASGLEDFVSLLTRLLAKDGKRDMLPRRMLDIHCSASVGATLRTIISKRLADFASSSGTGSSEADVDIRRILAAVIIVG